MIRQNRDRESLLFSLLFLSNFKIFSRFVCEMMLYICRVITIDILFHYYYKNKRLVSIL